ncbi:MAG: tRNA pseudouridine38-40 synthase [Rhodothermales bacterium]|jgi:tRNA pseudouridine38-40 synthase
MGRYRATVEYDGTGWHGWQSQPGAPTIQETLEDALATALRTRVSVVGSGRTDAGVHATGQVVHFDLDGDLDTERLHGQLQGLLPRSIAVRDVCRAHAEFHARYDATLRTYHYRVSEHPIAIGRSTRVHLQSTPDWELMNRSAMSLLGEANFSAFCRTASATPNRVCKVSIATWERMSDDGHWRFVVSADRFLHGMVRAFVGTLLEIGSGKRGQDDLVRVLESRDRREAGSAAPARGLTLARVDYPERV